MGSHTPEEVLAVLWRLQEEFLNAALHKVNDDFGGVLPYLVDVLEVDAAALKGAATATAAPVADVSGGVCLNCI